MTKNACENNNTSGKKCQMKGLSTGTGEHCICIVVVVFLLLPIVVRSCLLFVLYSVFPICFVLRELYSGSHFL